MKLYGPTKSELVESIERLKVAEKILDKIRLMNIINLGGQIEIALICVIEAKQTVEWMERTVIEDE